MERKMERTGTKISSHSSDEEIWEYRSTSKKISNRCHNSAVTSRSDAKAVHPLDIPQLTCRILRGNPSNQATQTPKRRKSVRPGTNRPRRSQPRKVSLRERADKPDTSCRSPAVGPNEEELSTSCGRCPLCQVPFSALCSDSPQFHVTECAGEPAASHSECTKGALCNSMSPSHYKQYKHSKLAQLESGISSAVQDKEVADVAKEGSVSGSQIDTIQNSRDLQHAAHRSLFGACVHQESNITENASDHESSQSKVTDNEGKTQERDTVASSEVGIVVIDSESSEGEGSTVLFSSQHTDSLSLEGNEHQSISGESGVKMNLDGVKTESEGCMPWKTKSPEQKNYARKSKTIHSGGKINSQSSILSFFRPLHAGVAPKKAKLSASDAFGAESGTKSSSTSAKMTTGRGTVEVESPKADSAKKQPWLLRSRTKCTTGSKSKSSFQDILQGPAKYQKSKKFIKDGENTHWKRTCPFYKRIPGTPFTVDAFSYGTIPGCEAYFLTHFHYDHYQGLTKSFPHSIYCSKVTANLVEKKIGVKRDKLHSLEMNTSHYLHGAEVILLDANHCPGSVMLLFKLPTGNVILHTGDFRATDDMLECGALKTVHVNKLFLDTTYCDPAYSFPSQQSVIAYTVGLCLKFVECNPTGLIVVGSYTIGKERIFLAIAEALNCKIYVSCEKRRVLTCLDDEAITCRLTKIANEAKVHVLPMNNLNYKKLSEYLSKSNCDKLLAFEPTGWTYREKSKNLTNIKPKISKNDITLYGIPYSEHSSFEEMKHFVQCLHPDVIIPTVNNTKREEREQMQEYFSEWLSV